MTLSTVFDKNLQNMLNKVILLDNSQVGHIIQYDAKTGKTIIQIHTSDESTIRQKLQIVQTSVGSHYITMSSESNKLSVGQNDDLISEENLDDNQLRTQHWLQEWMSQVSQVKSTVINDDWVELDGIGKFKGLEIASALHNDSNEISIVLKYDEFENPQIDQHTATYVKRVVKYLPTNKIMWCYGKQEGKYRIGLSKHSTILVTKDAIEFIDSKYND